ncbi:MAG: sigma-54-dependent Fis family transcriptional regulator [Candidatus Aminicenantes bacterium]|nr:sigma-54-dependent Fis family transcriptional regulator [Candidatus Aminicenantes bacterium]
MYESKAESLQELNLCIIAENSPEYQEIKQFTYDNDIALFFLEPEEDILFALSKNNISIVLIDMDKNKSEGLTRLDIIKQSDPLIDVILIGEGLIPENVVRLISMGATAYLEKPLTAESTQSTLQGIIDKRTLRKETFLLERKLEEKYYFNDIVGKSPYMLEIYSLIEKVAKHFTCILITGETGTGKEMVAKAIHRLSPNANPKLVICDCVSIPENLFESELFGYMRGAFTGADKDKKGLFEEAHEGIIFLDEIGEIPLTIQAKLLRVLEQHEFRPLGANDTRKVTVRVIAATSRNLRESISEGGFREDLFHRLNKIEIHLPPLRDRTEDIPLLTRHFLNAFNEKFDKDLKGISQKVQKLFLKYEWPGNVRELQNVLERASMLAKSHFINIPDLPQYLQDSIPSLTKIPFIRKEQLSTLEELEKEYILYLLNLVGKNMKKTAKILNISRTTLYNKLKKYNISP